MGTSSASTAVRDAIGRIGIWSLELRFGDPAAAADAVAELDDLGYGAAWVPGGVGGDLLGDMARLVAASSRITVAAGILNIWKHEAEAVGAWWAAQPDAVRDRILLGLGISHAPLIGDGWGKPVATMRAYLDRLVEAGLPADRLCLAALAPKMLELAGARTAGAHPYLVTPEHSAFAREALGPDALLAPEQGVVLERDPVRAREIARTAVDHYRQLPNYANNWKRLGLTEEDIATSSDRFIDALFVWGDADAIRARIDAHLAAGADHVCLQVVSGAKGADIAAVRPLWRALAGALL